MIVLTRALKTVLDHGRFSLSLNAGFSESSRPGKTTNSILGVQGLGVGRRCDGEQEEDAARLRRPVSKAFLEDDRGPRTAPSLA